MPVFLLLFIALPIIEIALLIKVGTAIGWLTTISVVILTAILGTYLLRQQGLATLSKVQQRVANGEAPAEQVIEGLLLVFGGALLLTPGFVTDTVGFLCLIPNTREWIAAQISKRWAVKVVAGTAGQTRPGASGGRGAGQPDVLEGEYRREED